MSDFWSRRKQAVEAAEAEARETAARLAEAEEAATREAAQAEMTEAELLEELGLPDPDTAKSGDDIAAFLAKSVPQHIRNRALRSLWRSNPVLACVDGLNDYDGDFTGNGLNGGVLKTSYQVGKGLTAHIEKMAQEAAAKDVVEPVPDPESEQKNQVFESSPPAEKSLAEPPSDVNGIQEDAAPEESATSEVQPRHRMRFTFEEDDHNERQHTRATGGSI